MDRPFGIVQGRLTVPPAGLLQWFPQQQWREEFQHAAALGISFIELLVERQLNPANPVWSAAGREEIRAAARDSGRDLYSICTDYIIDHALLGPDGAAVARHVAEVFDIAADLGCAVVVLPLLEASDLTPDSAVRYVPLLQEFARLAARGSATICIESLLPDGLLRETLERVGEPNVKCVFDTGNRAVDASSDPPAEIRRLGAWIGHVHIKDKTSRGENVLLGTGRVNFRDVFEALDDIGYGGPLVFETTRGTNPLVTARYHMDTCRFFSHEAARSQPA